LAGHASSSFLFGAASGPGCPRWLAVNKQQSKSDMKKQLLLRRIPLAIAAASLLCGLAAQADQLLKVPFDLPVKVSALVD